MNLSGCEWNWASPDFRYWPDICLEWQWKASSNIKVSGPTFQFGISQIGKRNVTHSTMANIGKKNGRFALNSPSLE